MHDLNSPSPTCRNCLRQAQAGRLYSVAGRDTITTRQPHALSAEAQAQQRSAVSTIKRCCSTRHRAQSRRAVAVESSLKEALWLGAEMSRPTAAGTTSLSARSRRLSFSKTTKKQLAVVPAILPSSLGGGYVDTGTACTALSSLSSWKRRTRRGRSTWRQTRLPP